MGLGFMDWIRMVQDTVRSDEPSGLIKGGKVFEKLSAYQLMKISAPRSLFISAITVLYLYYARKLLKMHVINI